MREHNKNEIDNRYGRLKVLSYKGLNNDNKAQWLCECDCGTIIVVSGKVLRSGNTVSCGCYKREIVTKHGLYKHKLYRIWIDMKGRCYNKNNKHYKDYGGRGITVCEEWKDVQLFFEDMLSTYENHKSQYKTTQLDRIDNNKGYYYENCKWSTAVENANNTRLLKEFIAISPEGKIYKVLSQSIFARENGLKTYGINNCLNKRQTSHKGWKFNYKGE